MADQLVFKNGSGSATHTLDDSGNATHSGTMTAGAVTTTGAASVGSMASTGAVSGTTGTFTGAVTTTRGVASGTALKVGGLAGVSVAASTAITGATETETNFDTTVTLPADTLAAGTVVKIRAFGVHTATTGSETHTILLKLGSTTIAQQALVDPTNNDAFYFDFELVCRTAGAEGTMVGCGARATGVPGTATPVIATLPSTAVDTTAALVVAVAIDRQGTATDSDSARLDFLKVEILG